MNFMDAKKLEKLNWILLAIFVFSLVAAQFHYHERAADGDSFSDCAVCDYINISFSIILTAFYVLFIASIICGESLRAVFNLPAQLFQHVLRNKAPPDKVF